MTPEQGWLLLGGVWLIAALIADPLPKGTPNLIMALFCAIAATCFCLAAFFA